MSKILKKKIIMEFVAVAAVGSISAKMIPMFSNTQTTTKESQNYSIKENNIKEAAVDSQNNYKYDVNKETNFLFNEKNSSDSIQYKKANINKQEIMNSKLEKSNDNISTNKKEVIISKSKKANNDTKKEEVISSQLEKTNDKNDSKKQEIISSKSEKPNNTNDTKKEKIISSQSEKTNDNNDTKKQEIFNLELEKSSVKNDINALASDNSKPNNANNNVKENQETTNETLEVKAPTIQYDRTTSIYENDNITLLRIEYYKNNKLTYYSVIEQFDATTKSYTEKIYQCNRDTNIDPLIRTDIYVNGNLTNSY